MTPDQLRHFQQKLQTLRADLLRELEASAAIRQPEDTRDGDQSDQASAETDRDLVGLNRERIRMLLGQSDAALARIENGTYGMCRDCGEPIAEARLKAIPWTRVCITCKEKQNS